jgi:hypothetical protein
MSALRRLAHALRRDRRASVITEFAILAPVMITLIAGSIELGHVAMAKSALDLAIGRAARDAMVDLKTPEAQREAKMRATIARAMATTARYPGREIEIETKVYHSFGSSYPEAYEDENQNGRYDGPSGAFTGEWFDDRNRNGVRDVATQQAGVLGGAGDVVAYTARFPLIVLFGFLPLDWGMGPIMLESSIMLRNEPVRPQ